MIRTAREKYLLIALCVVLGAVASYRFGVSMAWSRYLGLREKLATESQALSLAQRKVQRLPVLKEEVAEAKIRLQELRQPFEAVGREGATAYLLHLLPAGVQLSELVPETGEDKGHYRVSPVRLGLVGPLLKVQMFFDRLEGLPVYIRDLRMCPVEDRSAVEVAVKLDLFFRPAPPATAPVVRLFGRALRDPFAVPTEAVSAEPCGAITEGATGAQTEVRKIPGRVPESGAGGTAASPTETTDGRRREAEATAPEAVYVWPEGEAAKVPYRKYTFPVR